MYLYTKPLENSSCKQGKLTGFNFCYRANLSRIINEPVFTIALLQDIGSEYVVSHIYREMEDGVLCLRNISETTCCKLVTVEETQSLIVSSSFALAVVTSSASEGAGRLYTDGYTSGVVYSPPPAVLSEVGSVVGIERRTTGQIPVVFFRILLTAMVNDYKCITMVTNMQ